jgi:hypothetical protein
MNTSVNVTLPRQRTKPNLARLLLGVLVLPALLVGFGWGLTAGISCLVITVVLGGLVKNLTNRVVWQQWGVFIRHVSGSDIATVPCLILAVVAAALALHALAGVSPALSFLNWGWWSMLGGTGNLITGQTSSGPDWMGYAPFVIVPILLVNIPRLAHSEEEQYRFGAETQSWQQRLWTALKFGLVHLVMGIPVGVALALSIAGLGFLGVYLSAFKKTGDAVFATERAGAFHAAYNLTLIGSFAIYGVVHLLSS